MDQKLEKYLAKAEVLIEALPYIQRFNHKNIEDWVYGFINWCYSLPKFRELCGFEDKSWDLNLSKSL